MKNTPLLIVLSLILITSGTVILKTAMKQKAQRNTAPEIITNSTFTEPILLFPTKTPAQNEKLNLTFKDVLANQYIVTVRLCEEYKNNGINPCLTEFIYTLERKSPQAPLEISKNDFAYPGKISQSEDRITLTSELPLGFEESVDYQIETGVGSERKVEEKSFRRLSSES